MLKILQPSRFQSQQRLLFFLCSIGLFLWIIWLMKPGLQKEPGTDAGIFSAVAIELLHGQRLYVDVFESKPPLIFLLNALSLSSGLGYHAIRVFEMMILFGSGLLMLTKLNNWFKSLFPAFVASILFYGLILSSDLYSKGNQTELYAVICLASAHMLTLPNVNDRNNRFFIAGILFALSIGFREFFAPAVALLMAYALYTIHHPQKFRLLLGFITPFILIALWFSLREIWPGYVDYLSYQLSYKSFANDSYQAEASPMLFTLRMYRELLCDGNWITFGFLIAMWLVCFLPGPNKRLRFLPLILGILQLAQFFILSRSGYHFGHYYQLAVFPIFGSFLVAWHAVQRVKAPQKIILWGAMSLLVVWLVKPDRPLSDVFKGGLKGHSTNNISRHLQKEASDDDLLYVDVPSAGYYYSDNHLHSALRIPLPVYHYFSIPMFGNGPEKNAELQFQQMRTHPPRFIIRDSSYSLFIHRAQAISWLESHYKAIIRADNGHVLLEYDKN